MQAATARILNDAKHLKAMSAGDLFSQPVALRLNAVTVRIAGTAILEDVSFTAEGGSIVAIVGPSGAGKTTLLRSINGLAAITTGSIGRSGMTSKDCDAKPARIATIFQDHALIGRISAVENVLRGLIDRQAPLRFAFSWPHDTWCQAANALADVDLLDYATTPVRRLSGGQRQRVAIARALIREPQLLLADEPFASVDPVLRNKLSNLVVAKARARRTTTLIVLHDLETALAIADRVVGIRNGRVVFNGPAWAFDAAAYEKIYGKQSAIGRDSPAVQRLRTHIL